MEEKQAPCNMFEQQADAVRTEIANEYKQYKVGVAKLSD